MAATDPSATILHVDGQGRSRLVAAVSVQGRSGGARRRLGASRQHNYVSRQAFDYPQRTPGRPCDQDDFGARDGIPIFELAPGFRYVTGLAMRRAKRMLVASDKPVQPRGAKLPPQSIAPWCHSLHSMTLRATRSAALGRILARRTGEAVD
jgi:hypothetical protein